MPERDQSLLWKGSLVYPIVGCVLTSFVASCYAYFMNCLIHRLFLNRLSAKFRVHPLCCSFLCCIILIIRASENPEPSSVLTTGTNKPANRIETNLILHYPDFHSQSTSLPLTIWRIKVTDLFGFPPHEYSTSKIIIA